MYLSYKHIDVGFIYFEEILKIITDNQYASTFLFSHTTNILLQNHQQCSLTYLHFKINKFGTLSYIQRCFILTHEISIYIYIYTHIYILEWTSHNMICSSCHIYLGCQLIKRWDIKHIWVYSFHLLKFLTKAIIYNGFNSIVLHIEMRYVVFYEEASQYVYIYLWKI